VEAKGNVKDFYNSEKLRNRDIRDRVKLATTRNASRTGSEPSKVHLGHFASALFPVLKELVCCRLYAYHIAGLIALVCTFWLMSLAET
jgi:hypothetical protein